MGHQIIEDNLSPERQDIARAYKSLMEELEAISFYEQRASVCSDTELCRIFRHNADEEKEHASMLLEYIRRKDNVFSDSLKDVLFSAGPIEGD